MLSFIPSSSPNSNAFALFVSETYEYKDLKGVLTDDIKKKVDLFLKALKARNEKELACRHRERMSPHITLMVHIFVVLGHL